jgi:enoyl-CoA hydratase/carnithine racemase
MTDLICRIENTTARMTLNRPDVLNALSYEMCLEMEKHLLGWADSDTVTQVLIDANGEKAFCAGGDIQHLYDHGCAGDFAFGQRFWADEYRLNQLIAQYPKPYIAFMQGFVMGGGVGVSCHGSHRIVDDTSRIALPECGIGLIPDVGSSYLLATAPGHLGEYLGLTGTRMAAGDAVYAGFADHYIPGNQWPAAKDALVEAGAPEALSSFYVAAPEGGLATMQKTIDDIFSGDDVAIILADLESRDDEFSQTAAKALHRPSPLSMAAFLAVIRAVRQSPDIATALEWEYRVTSRSSKDGDFLEGIRASVIDKDRNPKWRHETVDAVSKNELAALLAPTERG